MASSAFKSTTKRTSIGSAAPEDSGSNSHRRSRSLSRFSRRIYSAGSYETPARRGKFVNTSRGTSELPEICSLDDLALEMFESANRWRSGENESQRSRGLEKSGLNSSIRRGRSISRHGVRDSDSGGGGGGRSGVSESVKSRRRSVSVARYRNSDSESEIAVSRKNPSLKKSSMAKSERSSSQRPAASDHRRTLGRSMSHRDLRKLQDDTSQSSILTDEDQRDSGFGRNATERTIRTVYAKKAEHPVGEDINAGLYNVMRKELRHAVEDIKLELEQARVHNNLSTSPDKNKKYNAAKLEQKQDLLDEDDPEISQILSDFLADSENDIEKPSPKTRKRSNDRRRMSRELTREAEMFLEDFLSSVEDTDLSSFEGERSDCGSSVGQTKRSSYPVTYSGRIDTFHTPAKSASIPVEMDGVVLPWLQWETSNDVSPASCNKSNSASGGLLSYNPQDVKAAHARSNDSNSSTDSCSPDNVNSQSQKPGNYYSGFNEVISASYKTHPSTESTKATKFDMEEYMDIRRSEELVFETWKQHTRICSGGLHLCCPMFL